MRLRVAIGADHGGFELKQELIRRLAGNLAIIDKGAYAYDAHDDYPDYVALVAHSVASGEADRGVLICGSGVGACVAANKIRGVRACVCHDTYSAHQGVEHDDLNVLCLGARVVGIEVATALAVAFLMARFSGEERHVRRLEKVKALEAQQQRLSDDVDAEDADSDESPTSSRADSLESEEGDDGESDEDEALEQDEEEPEEQEEVEEEAEVDDEEEVLGEEDNRNEEEDEDEEGEDEAKR